jgi:pyrimidine operon attenuation protein / uracil phosphoribosyltransferase
MAGRIVLMPKAHVERVVTRMAYQIQEDHAGTAPIVLYGHQVRGTWVAQRLAAALGPISTQPVRVVTVGEEPIEADADSYAVLVDDVIFSGRTLMRALRQVSSVRTQFVVRCAVLVDRGHRLLPIQPDFIGLVSPTKFDEHVEVEFDEAGNPESVVLRRG